MPFLGTLVNFFVVLIAGISGSLLKKGIPERIKNAVISAMAICVIYIGIDGALEKAPEVSADSFFEAGLVKILITILSLGIGAFIGELVDIDKWVNRLGEFLENKFTKVSESENTDTPDEMKNGEKGSFSRGFVACSILFCVGAMAVTGAMDDAMCKPDVLFAKSVIDGIMCFVMAAGMGIGCAFSAFLVLAYQGTLTVLGLFLVSVLPESMITYMSIAGSLVIVFIGTNMLGITKVKTANMIPAIFMPIPTAALFSLII